MTSGWTECATKALDNYLSVCYQLARHLHDALSLWTDSRLATEVTHFLLQGSTVFSFVSVISVAWRATPTNKKTY